MANDIHITLKVLRLPFLLELEFRNVGFSREGKTEKSSWSNGENHQQTQPTYVVNAGIWTRATLVGGEYSHHFDRPFLCLHDPRYPDFRAHFPVKMEDPIRLCAEVLGTVLRTGGFDSQDGGKIGHGSPILVLGSHKQSDYFRLRGIDQETVF